MSSKTVKQLAELSGVSVRTLHWYDEVGLLTPAYTGSNGYRYYETEQMLQLQQILFFRELGFSLKQIQSLLDQEDFDKVKALKAHRQTLENEVLRRKKLIQTIDKTLKHMERKEDMEEKDFYDGFDVEKQKEYEAYLVKYAGTAAEDKILECKKKTTAWKNQDWQAVKKEGEEIYKNIVDCIQRGLSPKDEEVQAIIHQHFTLMNRFYVVTQEIYFGLAQLYSEHPDFRRYFEPFHPELVEYLSEAMRFYAEREL